jgi:hypothetical protein
MTLRQSPSTTTLMLTPELLAHRRVSPGAGAVTHRRHLRLGEQLQLPHALNYPAPTDNFRPSAAVDHANRHRRKTHSRKAVRSSRQG